MKITWHFDLPKNSPIKSGDHLKFYLPINFQFNPDIMESVDKVSPLTDADGNVLGTTSTEGDRYVVISWNDYAEKYFKENGLLDNILVAYAGWNVVNSKTSRTVPINWGVNTHSVPSTPTVGPTPAPDPTPATPVGKDDFIINKSGNYGNPKTEAGYIYWSVRLNARKMNINNAVLNDQLSNGQTLYPNKGFQIWKYDLSTGWDMNKRTFISSGDYEKNGISVTPGLSANGSTHFQIHFGDIDSNTGYEVFYYSKYDPETTPDGTEYTNDADLNGIQFKKATAYNVHTADKVFIYEFIMGKKRPGGHVPKHDGGNPVNPTPTPTPNPTPTPTPTPAPKHPDFVLPNTSGGVDNKGG
ncbi:hypothetical protein G6R29_06365 [Fructobacillus sp. M2-14]|uniref:Uncharacterized protein n=1 Tax=Fructobacillus broussonetiae TaxID=2713173 RepID=A0ABS5R2G9_9LACO|nr:collagen binding domain-containing protein [Fructobacillus broussonetiae]MBS9339227.1 hypothetical protein [Fructobacillus broussonetiae]